jgi:hypothetical protein
VINCQIQTKENIEGYHTGQVKPNIGVQWNVMTYGIKGGTVGAVIEEENMIICHLKQKCLGGDMNTSERYPVNG